MPLNFLMISRAKAVFLIIFAMLTCLHGRKLHAEALQIRFVTFNVKYNNSDAQIQADIDKVVPKADVIMFQEVKDIDVDTFLDSSWDVYQVLNKTLGKREVALAYKSSLYSQVVAKGLEFGVDNHGEQLPDRYIVWADLKLTNGRTVRIMSLHFPPRSFEYLSTPYGQQCCRFR